MKLNPNKIHLKRLEEIKNVEGLELGYIKNLSPKQFIAITEEWVKKLEAYIMRTKKYSDAYIALFSERGVSYEEYKKLFLRITPEEYKRYPAYEYFMILDDTKHKSFIAEKEPTPESYVQTIKEAFDTGELEALHSKLNDLQANITIKTLQTHAYTVAKTGAGKSELLKQLLYKLSVETDDCIILIDPHGDLAEQLAGSIQKEQAHRLVYFDPFLFAEEKKYPVINPFEITDSSEQNIDLLAQNLTASFQELLSNELSTNMKAVLEPCIASMLRKEGRSLKDLQQLLKGDKELLEEAKQASQHHRLFFENFNDSTYKQTKSAIFTKLQSLLNSRTFHHCITGKSSIDLKQAIREKKILLFNLNKGKFGEEHAQAFGKLLVSQIKNYALMQSMEERHQIYLAVDEAGNFISKSMQTILTEARKYRLSLLISTQMTNQLNSIEETVLSNVGSFLVGNLNSKESIQKISEVTGATTKQLKQIDKHEFWYKGSDTSFSFSPNLLPNYPLDKQKCRRYYTNKDSEQESNTNFGTNGKPKYDF